MKKALAIAISVSLLLLSSCELGNWFSGGGHTAGNPILYYSHTIAATDEIYDTAAGNYKIMIENENFAGIYWSELWVVRDDGSLAKAVPYKVSGDSTWYMRSANYEGSVKFRSEGSQEGKEFYIFYCLGEAE